MYLLDRTLCGHCLGTFVEINHKKEKHAGVRIIYRIHINYNHIFLFIYRSRNVLKKSNPFLTSTPQLLLLQGFYIHRFDARYE